MQLSLLAAVASTLVASVSGAFQDEILAAHNHYRTLHQAPALAWSASAATVAQAHVSSCNFALYSGSGGYGQIIGAGGFDPISTLVDYWYEGAADYDYANPGFSQATGAFTQIVWKASTTVGCGYQDCDGLNGTPGGYVACLYLPAGNVQGRFPQNVLPPTGPVTPATISPGVAQAESRFASTASNSAQSAKMQAASVAARRRF